MIHWFDLFVIFFLLASAIWSFFRGFGKEVFSILSIALGYLLASRYFVEGAPLFESFIPDRPLREMAAFTALFFFTILAVIIVGIIVRRALNIHHTISRLDKFAGFGIGIVKGGLILCIIAYPLALVPGLQEDLTKGSKAAPALIGISGAILAKFAPGLTSSVESFTGNTKSLEERKDTIKKYRKTIDNIGEKIEKGAKAVKDKVEDLSGGLDDTSNKKKTKIAPDEILPSEKDRKELDTIIDTADSGG
ncbi:hypothetical protein MNBD_NITROSPINAE02-1869 [hydrothermal vent metagenome]|uniref:Colicin V production protein n=1 Tax=hydrothermal vent metagenome TaxID=652676 RepID=A0A3B1BLR9_9ZZZZ